MSTITKVLVADDHGVVRKGLRFLLQTDPGIEVIGEASDGREAVRLTEQLGPNVVVMDITMPQLNGIDAASQIVKRDPSVGIIMLSMHCDETFLVRALAAGAQGYLLKDCAEADLLQAVRSVANKKLFFIVPIFFTAPRVSREANSHPAAPIRPNFNNEHKACAAR